MSDVRLAPSILAADFSRLGAQVEEALEAGIDWIHVDVMDGHFVPNISIGPLIVEALRPLAEAYDAVLDVHLMIDEPDRYVEAFVAAGAHRITIHVEATNHLHRTIQHIRDLGAQPGVALNPATSLTAVQEILPLIDLLLVMSVNPGFGGQSYIPTSTRKIALARRMLDETGATAELQVDGGIKPANAGEVAAAGATILVAGSAIFGGPESISHNIGSFQEVLDL